MKRFSKLLIFILAISLVFALTACGNTSGENSDTVYKLALTTHNSDSNVTVLVLEEWADKIREESNGRLDITVYGGGTLSNANDALATTGTGGADLCWITVSQNASSLPISTFSTIPTLKYTNTYQSTYMMVKTVQQFPEIVQEFAAQNVRLLAVHGSSPAWILSSGVSLNSASDFEGELFMSANPNYIAMLEGMGASCMSDLPTQMYDSMSKGIYKSVLCDFQAACAFNIPEVIDRAYDYNFGCVISYVAINLDIYNALPDDLQQLLDAQFEDLSMEFAAALNDVTSDEVVQLLELGNEIIKTSPEIVEKLDRIATEQLIPGYLAQCKKVGADGQAILDYATQMVEEAKTVYGEEYNWIQ